ncbi:hypothetical protein ACO1NF_13955, partial [Staphylococcus aureus]
MSDSLSLRARLLGPLSERLLKPIMASPAERMRLRLELVAGLIARVPSGVRVRSTTIGGVPADEIAPKADATG